MQAVDFVDAVVAGAVPDPLVVAEVDVGVGVELGCVAGGAVFACGVGVSDELCEELPQAASASVQAKISTARILM